MFELSADVHREYYSSNALHPHLPSAHPDYPVDRDAFAIDREQYWKDRAAREETRRDNLNRSSGKCGG